MKEYKFSTLKRFVKKFSGKKVLVVGDLLLDQFIWGDVSRISPEAPVPVVWVRKEDYMPGGACNVANNLASVEGEVHLAGVVGEDNNAEILKERLQSNNIDVGGILVDRSRSTILKTRVIAHQQQVVRIDREQTEHISDKYTKSLLEYVESKINELDAIIIEDYGKGLITPSLVSGIVPLARANKKLVAVDPKEDHFSYYKGVDLITPNHHEAARAVGFKITDENSLRKAGGILLEKLESRVILITLGEDGMMVFSKDGPARRIPTLAQEVYDVSGAGDTVIAIYTLALSSGASPIVAAHIANCAAGLVVGKIGVAMVEKNELINRLRKETKGSFV